MCRLYEVTRAGYYAWRTREPSARRLGNERLLKQIEQVHASSGGTYGSPRIQRALCVRGVHVGKNRVARLMRKHQIRARAARIYRPNAGVHRFFEAIPKQRLKALSVNPNVVWLGIVEISGDGDGSVYAPGDRLESGPEEERKANAASVRSSGASPPPTAGVDLPQ
jgi:putative transposase